MSKIEINKAVEIIKRNGVDNPLLRQIVEEFNMIIQADSEDEKPPAIKKQFAILISDPDGVMPKTELAGWVLQLPESESVATVEERIFRGAYDYNTTRKGRHYPAKTVGEALENVPAKHFKEYDLWVKTKTPVLVLRTNNEIPKEKTE